MLDDGEVCVCPQVITYSHIICKWLKIAVLPLDKGLDENWTFQVTPKSGWSNNTFLIIISGVLLIIIKANKTKYCDNCRVVVRRKKKAEYERNRRLRMGK